MSDRSISRHQWGRSGFTMIELALTLTVVAIMTAMMIPKFGRVMNSTRVSRSAAVVASDLEQAFTLAGRFRKPMRITCCTIAGVTASYTVTDVAGGTVRLTRRLQDTDLGNMTLTQELPIAGTVDVFPSGVSTAPLRFRITSGSSTRGITLSTSGHVRIIP
jgi:prepilin-type N-terminal cleavage/methylation domain-containing protein